MLHPPYSQGSALTSPGATKKEKIETYDASLIAPQYMRKLFWLSLIPFSFVFYLMWDMSQQFLDNSTRVGDPIRLRDGWFFGRMIDLSDNQWNSFRKFLPLLFGVGIAHVFISQTLRKQFGSRGQVLWNIFFSMAFMGYIHQLTIIFPVLVACVNFAIAKYFRTSKWTVILTWLFNLTILFSSKHFDGYKFESMHESMKWLDEYRGVFNWATCFNISFCRLISFNIDYYYACQYEPETEILRKKYNQSVQSSWNENRKRQERILYADRDYDFLHFIMYVFYVPLYIGGPVTGYNAFFSFIEHKPQTEVNRTGLYKMAARVILYVFCLEVFLHFIYSVGFSEQRFWDPDTPLLDRYYVKTIMSPMTSLQIAMNGLMVLVFMYMKFLIIWRFFRLWSLSDGVNPPENMTRCIINNYSISGFWRSWHRSLYYFILRYIYVPLGGSKSKMWSVWIIFLFIAVWHDLWMRWIAWAFFNCCGIILEMVVTHLIGKTKPILAIKKMSNPSRPYYFFMVVLLGAVSFGIMVVSNLSIMYGFAGTRNMLGALYNHESFWQLGLVLAWCWPMATVGCLMYEEYEFARNAKQKL